MKNLKRLLSLALVLVMAMSMLVYASAADLTKFSDAGDIDPDFVEAVDVAVALGIIDGYEDGTLSPQKTITRAEIAKIATFLRAGSAAAERLAPQETGYSDVPASHWASKYIAYLSELGIISGRGDGRFDPSAPVTGTEVGKIFLGALGYGVLDEFVGKNWALNVVSRGSAVGIYTLDTSIDLAAPATREQVFQYLFNTLKTDIVNGKNYIVEYSEFIKNYVPSGRDALNQTSALEANMFLGWRNFGLSNKITTNDFGVDYRVWMQNGRVITSEYLAETLIDEFIIEKKMTKSDLALAYVWDSHIELWVNGDRDIDIGAITYNPNSSIPYITSPTPAAASDNFAKRGDASFLFDADFIGAKVQLFDVGGDIDSKTGAYDVLENGAVGKMVITFEQLAKVVKVNAAAGTIDVTVYDFGSMTEVKVSNVVAEGYAVNDYVSVTLKHAGDASTTTASWNAAATRFQFDATAAPLSVVKAEKVTGVAKTYMRADRYATAPSTFVDRLSNVTVNVGEDIDAPKVTFVGHYMLGLGKVPTFADTNDYFLNSDGYVIGWTGNTSQYANMNYLLVRGIADYTSDPFTAAGVVVAVTYGDTGIKATLELAVTNGHVKINGVDVPTTTFGAGYTAFNGWYAYTKTDAGVVTLTAPTQTGAGPIQATANGVYDFGDLLAGPYAKPTYVVGRQYQQNKLPTTAGTLNAYALFDTNAVSGGQNLFGSFTIGYFNGQKYTGSSTFPLGTLYTGEPARIDQVTNFFKNTLIIRDPETNNALVCYNLDESATPAASAYAVITGEPYAATSASTDTAYPAAGPSGISQVVQTKDLTTVYNVGTIVNLRVVDGKYIIDSVATPSATGVVVAKGENFITLDGMYGRATYSLPATPIIFDNTATTPVVGSLFDVKLGQSVSAMMNSTTYLFDLWVITAPASTTTALNGLNGLFTFDSTFTDRYIDAATFAPGYDLEDTIKARLASYGYADAVVTVTTGSAVAGFWGQVIQNAYTVDIENTGYTTAPINVGVYNSNTAVAAKMIPVVIAGTAIEDTANVTTALIGGTAMVAGDFDAADLMFAFPTAPDAAAAAALNMTLGAADPGTPTALVPASTYAAIATPGVYELGGTYYVIFA